MNSARMRIGEVATRSGVSIDTVRYYERRRLLPRAARSSGGFRLFTSETIERVKFIRQAQELGFTLDEILEILASGGAQECLRVRDLLRRKLAEIDERMRVMGEFRRTLAHHLAACEKELGDRGSNAQCPVLTPFLPTPTKKAGS